MSDAIVTTTQAAKELNIGVLTLRGLMAEQKINIGYALKRPGASKWHYVIYRGLLDEEKKRLNIK